MAMEKLKTCATVLFADMRGRGTVESAPMNTNRRFKRYGTESWFQNHSVMMGSSALAQRTHDILRWFAFLETLGHPLSSIHLVTQGTAGLAALFAGVLAGPPQSFKWIDPLPDWDTIISARHYDYDQLNQGLITFGIARYFSMETLLQVVQQA